MTGAVGNRPHSALECTVGVYLVDETRGKDLHCNWWNWRPTVELLSRHGIVEAPKLQGDGSRMVISPKEAIAIAEFLDKEILPTLTPTGRIRLDLSVTSEPDTGEHFRDPKKVHLNYAATYEWLVMLRDFCRVCDGFYVSP